MKKIIAYIIRWFHLMYHFTLLEFHYGFETGYWIKIFGRNFWFVTDSIECNCGKVFYDKFCKKNK